MTTWIEDIASSSASTEDDANRIQHLLRQIGFPSARIVLGIVYLEGRGTMENPPTSIQAIAKSLAAIAAKSDLSFEVKA